MKSHTFSRILFTFISILTVTVTTIGMFSYYAYRSSTIKSAIDSGKMNVTFISEQVDNEIQNLRYATLSILNNKELKNFEYFSKSVSPDSLFRTKDMMREISYLQNSYPSLKSIWLYGLNNHVVLTSQGCFNDEEFFQKRTRINNISGKDFSSSMSKDFTFQYLCTSTIEDPNGKSECFSFIRSITNYSEKPDGQILLNMDSGILSSIMNKASQKKELTVILLDDENHVITATASAVFPYEEYTDIMKEIGDGSLKEKGGIYSINAGGEQYSGWITDSSENGLQYLTLINNRMLLQNVDYIRVVTFSLLAVCLVLSVFLTSAITNRMFLPIKNILRYIKMEQHLDGVSENYNDIALIEKFIDYMKAQNAVLQNTVNSYTAIMQEMLLTELLYSSEQPSLMEIYQEYDLTAIFPYKCFTAAIIPIQQSENGYSLDKEVMEDRIFVLQNSDRHRQNLKIYPLTHNEWLILIFNSKNQSKDSIVNDFMDDLKTEYFSQTGANLLCAYGKTFASILKLYDSFHQAINVLTIKPYTSENSPVSYQQAMESTYITSNYTKDMEVRLIRMVKSGTSGDSAMCVLREIIDQNKNDHFSPLKLESLFVQLIMTINRIIDEMSLDSGAIFEKDINHYRVLDRYPTIQEKERYIIGTYDKLITYAKNLKSNKSYEIYLEMLNYVTENYSNDISLNDFSYRVNLSPSYLSSLFKEYQHNTFLDYINHFRISKAKPLLINTSQPISQIAEQVGYGNVNTFIRIFKKLESLTPGQYRMGKP